METVQRCSLDVSCVQYKKGRSKLQNCFLYPWLTLAAPVSSQWSGRVRAAASVHPRASPCVPVRPRVRGPGREPALSLCPGCLHPCTSLEESVTRHVGLALVSLALHLSSRFVFLQPESVRPSDLPGQPCAHLILPLQDTFPRLSSSPFISASSVCFRGLV